MMRFRMVKINVDQFALLSDSVPSDGILFNFNLGFNAAANVCRIACAFTVEFRYGEMPLLKLGINCEFDVLEEDWNSCMKDGVLKVPKEDLGFFANQTVGVARGILFCKTDNTEFRNFILPPINLTEILNDDLIINFAEEDR